MIESAVKYAPEMVESSSSTFNTDFIADRPSDQSETSAADTARRLDYAAISRCGIREYELNTLLQYASSDVNTETPTVWLEAEPGVGKSALLARFREEIRSRGSAITISGKFEERAAASEPFKALREAIAELVHHMMTRENHTKWCQDLRDQMKDDIDLVTSILPCLEPCLGPSKSSANLHQYNYVEYMEAKYFMEAKYEETGDDAFGNFSKKEYRFVRFRLAVRTLIRFICAMLLEEQQTLVFLLDDFHWIDPDSLQIIKTLMEDTKKPTNFFLLAATRPLEDFAHLNDLYRTMTLPLGDPAPKSSNSMRLSCRSSARKSICAANPNNHFDKLRVVGLEQLSLEDIGIILKALLGPDDTQELTNIVKEKTQGNLFVLVQFLRLLERCGDLYYSHEENKWKFDVQKISQVDQISDKVSEVVTRNLEASEKRRKSALIVAASFGVSQFDVATIVHAVAVLEEEDESSSDLIHVEDDDDPYVVEKRVMEMSSELKEAALEGYVEETRPGQFRFSHDRIRESAYSLLPEGKSRKEVHLRVGRQLRSWMDTQSELGLIQNGLSKESLLLHATKQLNAGADLISDDWELLDLVDLNYQAAELAADKTAFFSSIEYLQLGLSLLDGKDGWKRHYDRVLSFHVALTRMQYSCGLLDECWETSESVIANAKNFRDMNGIYHTRILCLMQNELMEEAMNLTLDVFEMMGKPKPRHFVIAHAMKDMLKARRFLSGVSDEELLDLPVVQDEELQTEWDLMFTLMEIDFLSQNSGYCLLIPTGMILHMAERGNFPRSFFATGLYAVFFKAQLCDFKEAMHYGSLALKLSAKQRSLTPGYAARWDFFFQAFINHWQVPILQTLAPIVDAFQRLWSSGLIDTYLMDVCALLQHYFAAGEAVDKTLQECIRCSEAFEDYQQMYYWHANATEHQAMLNFQGNCKNPSVLDGDLLDAAACQEIWTATGNKSAIYNFQFWSIVLGYHFGNLQSSKQNIKAMRKDFMEDGPTVLVPLTNFYVSLVYMALYKDTRKSKYRSRAQNHWKTLHGWAKKGAVNCRYMCDLLQAEHLSSESRTSKGNAATEAYETAIKSVSEAGLLHHMALANELAGVHVLSTNDANRAAFYLRAAIHLYEKWGASAKAESMRFKYSKCLSTTPT